MQKECIQIPVDQNNNINRPVRTAKCHGDQCVTTPTDHTHIWHQLVCTENHPVHAHSISTHACMPFITQIDQTTPTHRQWIVCEQCALRPWKCSHCSWIRLTRTFIYCCMNHASSTESCLKHWIMPQALFHPGMVPGIWHGSSLLGYPNFIEHVARPCYKAKTMLPGTMVRCSLNHGAN